MTRETYVPVLCVRGLVGWHENGTSQWGTYSREVDAPPDGCPAIDMRPVYEADGVGASAANIWRRPNLAPDLPAGNVRSLFEGCIGYEGTTDGHPWDGNLESLRSMDSVGVDVYTAVLIAAGGVRIQ